MIITGNVAGGDGRIDRRHFLKTISIAAGVAAGAPIVEARSNFNRDLVDVNVHLSRWPLRRVTGDESTSELRRILVEKGVRQAWVGNFDAVLQKDIAQANSWLAGQCARYGQGVFLPAGTVNPAAPDWEEDFRRCVQLDGMKMIRVYPGYHGYDTGDPRFHQLLELAAQHRILAQLVVALEDPRMMHPLLRAPDANLEGLASALKANPEVKLMLLNSGKVGMKTLKSLVQARNVYVEIAMLEGVGGIARWLSELPVDRILFGSHAPLFYFEAAFLKLKESALSPNDLQAIRYGNAARLATLH